MFLTRKTDMTWSSSSHRSRWRVTQRVSNTFKTPKETGRIHCSSFPRTEENKIAGKRSKLMWNIPSAFTLHVALLIRTVGLNCCISWLHTLTLHRTPMVVYFQIGDRSLQIHRLFYWSGHTDLNCELIAFNSSLFLLFIDYNIVPTKTTSLILLLKCKCFCFEGLCEWSCWFE